LTTFKHALILSAAVAALALVPIAAGGSAAPAATAPKSFTLAYGCETCSPTHVWTQAQANQHAAAFNVISAAPYAYDGLVAGMKQTNPAVQIYGYEDLAETPIGSLAESCYLHSAAPGTSSNRVRVKAGGNWATDPKSTCWIANQQQLAYTILDASDNGRKDHSVGKAGPTYDGIFTDNTGWPVLSSAVPAAIDPRTGRAYAPQQYENDILALADAVSRSVGKPVLGNALWVGAQYFANPPTSQAFGHMSIAMAEGFMRWTNTPLNSFRNLTGWKQDVDMLVDAGNKGKSVITLVQVDPNLKPTQAQLDQWHKYALASFLLGTNGKSYFRFNLTRTGPGTPSPWDNAPVGTPTNAYFKNAPGAYERDFTSGKALVNPTTATVTVPLGGSYYTLGRQRVTSVTLAPHTGEVVTLT